MKIITIIMSFLIFTSCGTFGTTKEEKRNNEVNKYINKLKSLRAQKLTKKSEWIPFYVPREDS